MNDEQLITALQRKDEKAFMELVRSNQSAIVSTCYGFLKNQEEAEDVAQEVFIQVYKKIKHFRGDAKLSTWMYRIAVNLSLNRLRSRKNRFLQSLDIIFDTPHADSTLSPLDDLENKERGEYLANAIGRLPDNQRTAFILSKHEGLPNKKIAEVMEFSLSAVEALLNRAKKNLQKQLVEFYKKS